MIQVSSNLTAWLVRSLFSEVARQLLAFITPCAASFLSLSFLSRCVVSLPPVNYVTISTHNKMESRLFVACDTRKRFLCGDIPAWPGSVVQFSVCRNGPVTFRMSVCLSVCKHVSLTTRWRTVRGLVYCFTALRLPFATFIDIEWLHLKTYRRLSERTRQATYVQNVIQWYLG
jgi:hypothetical protein